MDGQITKLFQNDILLLGKHFDFILFDCAPGISPVTEIAIRLGDLVIVPTIPDYLSVYGFELKRPALLARFKSFLKSCPFVFFRDRRKAKEILESPIEVKTIWEAYGDQELFLHRLLRAVFFTIFMLLFTWFVLVPLLGLPSFPYRSNYAWWV